jgi:hypothetical protein
MMNLRKSDLIGENKVLDTLAEHDFLTQSDSACSARLVSPLIVRRRAVENIHVLFRLAVSARGIPLMRWFLIHDPRQSVSNRMISAPPVISRLSSLRFTAPSAHSAPRGPTLRGRAPPSASPSKSLPLTFLVRVLSGAAPITSHAANVHPRFNSTVAFLARFPLALPVRLPHRASATSRRTSGASPRVRRARLPVPPRLRTGANTFGTDENKFWASDGQRLEVTRGRAGCRQGAEMRGGEHFDETCLDINETWTVSPDWNC